MPNVNDYTWTDPATGKPTAPGIGQPTPKIKENEPYITQDASADLVGGSSNVTSQADQLKRDYDALIKSQQPAASTPTTTEPTNPYLTAINNASEAMKKTSTPEEQQIKAAGEAAGAQYAPLIAKATAEKGKGLGMSEVATGEAGGFMNTQMVGAAAEAGLSPEQAAIMGRYGIGGELSRVKSEYDTQIATLEAQKNAAIKNAENEMRTFIQTGKKDNFDAAYKAFQAAEEANKNKLAAANAMADNIQKQLNYQLEVQKFGYQQYNDNIKNSLDSAKLDVDIANVTGKWTDGSMTLAAKKNLVDEQYKKLGAALDEKKFNWQMTSDELKLDLEKKKYELDKSKQDALTNGIDVEQSVRDAMNGLPGIEKGQPGYQAYKAKLNAVATMLKNEGNTTKNPYFDIKASAANKATLTNTSQDNMSKMLSAMNNLDRVKETFEKLRKEGKLGVVMGNLSKYNFADPDVVTFKAQIAGLIPLVARGVYGEVGVLTDNDMATYAKTIMAMGNPEKAGDAIYLNLYDTIKNKVSGDLKSAVANGKNVSGYANDYLNMVASINKMTGEKFTPSVNEAAFDHWDQFSAQLGQQMSEEWLNNHAEMMFNANIPLDQVEDYFQEVKKSKLDSDIYKDIDAANEAKQSGKSNVGSDTNKASSKIVDTKVGNKTIKVAESISDKIAKADADYFKDTGKHLQINQSFRTRAEQEKLYKELKPKGAQVAKPGTSFHEKGLAVDVTNWKEAEKYLNKYGLRNDLQNDKGHFSWGEMA